MADKSTDVKKTVKKAEIKADAAVAKKSSKELMKDLRDLSEIELNSKLKEAKEDLKRAQQMLKSGELPSSHVLKQTRAKIARIHTVMTEKKNSKEAK